MSEHAPATPSDRCHRVGSGLAAPLSSLLAVLLLLVLFAALTSCVYPVDRCLSLDRAVHEALESQAPRGFGLIMRLGRLLNNGAILLAPLLLAALLLHRRLAAALVVALSEAGGYGLHLVLKGAIHRARPGDDISPLAHPSVYLFPSGHTIAAIVVFGLAAYIIAEGRSRATRRVLTATAAVAVALSLLSLVYFDYHYATDVVGGLLVGGAWLIATLAVLRAVRAPGAAADQADTSPTEP